MITSNYLILTNYITLIFFPPGVCHKVNRETQTITLTFTPMINLEPPVNQTLLTACLWTFGGSQSETLHLLVSLYNNNIVQ